MNITYRNILSVKDYQALREMVHWDKLADEQAQDGLSGSAYVVGCYDDEKIIGCARITWDGGYFAYLADVIVRPEYRQMGFGTRMVEMAIEFVRSKLKDGWKVKIVLVSAKGKEEFYKKFGFVERPNENAGAGMELLVG